MVSKIEIFKVSVKKGFLGVKSYLKRNITNQLEMPLYNTFQRDGVLDTTRVSLVNKNKTPLKPFSRIIIKIYERNNGSEKLVSEVFRLVDNDNVENIARGINGLYRHTLSLIEITKILERRTVDSLTYTNYLRNDFVGDLAVEPLIKNECSYQIDSAGWKYASTSSRFTGPYVLSNTSISTNVLVNIDGVITFNGPGILGFLNKYTENYALSLNKFYVKKPDGTTQNLSTSGNFTYTTPGEYKFIQVYYRRVQTTDGSALYHHDLQASLTWTIKCVSESIPQITTYNMREVVERLLVCHKALIKNSDTQEFYLDYETSERLDKIKAPEFAITQGTLLEALSQIGNYINAIPRLTIRKIGDDDYTNWNIITFDFLDDGTELSKKNYSLLDLENPSEEFADNFVSNIQNATVSNYSGKSSVIEPARGGFLSTRTESGVFEVSDNECIFRTRHKIRSIVKVEVIYDGIIQDITTRVVEKSKYNLKSAYDSSLTHDMKSYYLYYEEGKENLYGLSFVKEQPSSLSAWGLKEAIKNITGYGGNIKDIAFNIEYVAWVKFKARQYKSFIDNEAEDSSLYYNQQSNEVDIDAYGENMHFALTKTGNVKLSKTQYFNNLSDAPHCGQYYKDGGDKYVVFQTNSEIITGAPIKQTTVFAKNYQELFAQIAIKSAIRQFEISERESVERNIDIQNFCLVDTNLDLDEMFNGSFNVNATTENKTMIRSKLWGGFGGEENLSNLSLHFSKTTGQTERVSTAVICRMKYSKNNGSRVVKNILCPASFHAFGRSIVCYFSMDDNYSAGTFIDVSKTGIEDVDIGNDSIIERPKGTFAIENYIQYSNDYGRTDYLEFAFIGKISSSNWGKQAGAYYLYDLDGRADDYLSRNASVYFGYGDMDNGAIILNKDSREKISVTCQLNFVSKNKNIEIYKAMVDTLPYICDSKTKFKFVVFSEEQGKENDRVIGSFSEIGNGVSSFYDTYSASITIKPRGLSGTIVSNSKGKGYGLITDDSRMCIFIREEITINKTLNSIKLMFRPKI